MLLPKPSRRPVDLAPAEKATDVAETSSDVGEGGFGGTFGGALLTSGSFTMMSASGGFERRQELALGEQLKRRQGEDRLRSSLSKVARRSIGEGRLQGTACQASCATGAAETKEAGPQEEAQVPLFDILLHALIYRYPLSCEWLETCLHCSSRWRWASLIHKSQN